MPLGTDGIVLPGNWKEIKASLLAGEYTPSPVKRVELPKDSGGTRPLGIPTVMDRVIQQAVCQVLTPVFDPLFSESSFGFRPGRSAHQAVKRVLKDIQRGCRYAVDCNIYVKSKGAGEREKRSITRFLAKRLRLKENEGKSAVDRPCNRSLLGCTMTAHREPKVKVSPKAR